MNSFHKKLYEIIKLVNNLFCKRYKYCFYPYCIKNTYFKTYLVCNLLNVNDCYIVSDSAVQNKSLIDIV